MFSIEQKHLADFLTDFLNKWVTLQLPTYCGVVLCYRSNVIRMEESVLANEKRLQEKMHECAALGGELDRARDDTARALQRANERMETLRKLVPIPTN